MKCPYCGKDFYKLSPSHLRTHGKTMSDCKVEHPKFPSHQYAGTLYGSGQIASPLEKDIGNYYSGHESSRLRSKAKKGHTFRGSRSNVPVFTSPK